MATSSWTLTAEEVLALLDQQEELEDAFGVDLDAESEDEDLPEGDFTDQDGTRALVQPELLASVCVPPGDCVPPRGLCAPEHISLVIYVPLNRYRWLNHQH